MSGRIVLLMLAGIGLCPAARPAPCIAVRQLDYWLGDWTVTSPDAPGTGHSKVYSSLDGCLATESWSSDTTNHKGENALAYSADDQAWHGLFVDNQGRVHAFKGTVTAGVAELSGPSRDDSGRAIVKRVRIVRVDADHIQQIWERSADNGRTWTTEYRMDYSRWKTQGSLPQPDARVVAGALVGTWAASAQGRVAEFLGIPYAAPPVRDLRWKAPQPAHAWAGTRDATQFGASCPQLPASWLPQLPWSEDCLYLNVWTPRLSADARLPVIVWIHGGGNKAGRSQQDGIGPSLAPLGAVVVSFNYRLGPFGFLAHAALTAESEHHSSGNYGLLDQLQALKWVSHNIAQFGGDPKNITLAGQSAGAVDACLLMSSPLSQGLFQRAIMQSGDCQGVLNEDIRTPLEYNQISSDGEDMGQRLARDLGIASGPDVLRQMRSASPEGILEAWRADPALHFDAIVDDWIVPEQPARVFAEGRQVRVPVLVGSNADEATVLAHSVKNIHEFQRYLRNDTGEYAKRELELYPAVSDTEVPGRYLEIQNDSFDYGAYSMAQATSRAGENAYLYYFSWANVGDPARFGAYHGEELRFLNGSFPRDRTSSPGADELGLAMRTYWTQFARTGNPNSPSFPEWPAFDSRKDQCLDLGSVIRVREVPNLGRLQVLERIMKQIVNQTQSASR